RRPQHRRPQHDVGEGVLGVLPREAAAGEERLQRLRRQLDDPVALDPPGPPPFEVELLRREHAELHAAEPTAADPERYGSVWTITSATPGTSVRMRSSISLARACASASGAVGSRPRVRNTTSPSPVCRKRSARGGPPVHTETIRVTASASRATSRPCGL